MTAQCEVHDLVVLGEFTWPVGMEPPAVPGYVVSSFSPLVVAVADRCLEQLDGGAGHTGVVLVSASGDRASAEHVHEAVVDGRRVGPLLFFQSVPNSAAGYVAAKWGLRGPVVCLGAEPVDAYRAGLDEAAVLIGDGDADEVLIVLVEQTPDGDTAAAVLVSGEQR